MNNSQYVPQACVWELTLQCNMRCIHCGSSAGRARKDELDVNECLRIADDLVALGCRQTTLIGGEVFLYAGWHEVARRLSDAGTIVNIITNAMTLGKKQIDEIRNAKLTNVCISLDGMEANHNRIRNSPRAFEKVLDGIKLLRTEEIPIGIVTSLLDFNFYDLENMYDLLVQNKVVAWQIQVATPMGNMAKNRGLALDPPKMPLITKFIRDKKERQEMRIYPGDDIGYFDEHEMYLRTRPGAICSWNGCQAGLKVIGIDSAGNVKGCESIYSDEFIEGNLRQASLEEIWSKEGNFAYNRQFDTSMLKGRCAGCDKGARCRGGCHGASYFTTGSIFENRYCCYPGKSSQ